MTKAIRLRQIKNAIKYIAKVDNETALGYAGIFEDISDRWSKSEMKKINMKISK